MSSFLLVKNSSFNNFERNDIYFLRTLKNIIEPFQSLKFTKYHYYKINNILPLQTLNELISLYKVKYLLVGGCIDNHLFINSLLPSTFPCFSIPNHKDFTTSTLQLILHATYQKQNTYKPTSIYTEQLYPNYVILW